ncbi:transmembrane protein 53-like [Iris pallida]|uniref:Transmembrane protein 53-like n=1 Tax=Iris pallida TaxID=29817 RepID=A0AAX6ENG7_IRIPA|nr:transmembrane protein 53-like [Iris pallida]
MEAPARLLASRHLLLVPSKRSFPISSLSPLLRNPSPNPKNVFRRHSSNFSLSSSRHFSNPRNPFLSISSVHLSSHRSVDVAGDGDDRGLGFCSERGPIWTVVLLGWLGAEEKHLKRYAEMYAAKGIRPVRFVVPVRETVGLDLCRRLEDRIERLAGEIAAWCGESEADGRERRLIFHTFSNTGWLIYGVLLQNFQSRNDIIKKIKGCIVDSAPSAEISPQVWAAGYCAALLKRGNSSFLETTEGGKLDGRGNKLNTRDMIPALIEMITLKLLELFFAVILLLPYANQRLTSVISTLKDQPPCPQLYLYSSADKVIPAHAVESFIQEQKALGKIVFSHDFGLSPHVDHFRTFPHIYSAKLNEFLRHCCMPMAQKG